MGNRQGLLMVTSGDHWLLVGQARAASPGLGLGLLPWPVTQKYDLSKPPLVTSGLAPPSPTLPLSHLSRVYWYGLCPGPFGPWQGWNENLELKFYAQSNVKLAWYNERLHLNKRPWVQFGQHQPMSKVVKPVCIFLFYMLWSSISNTPSTSL